MAAKDLIHDPVRKALENEGWVITHEHMKIEFEDAYVNIDLGAGGFWWRTEPVKKLPLKLKVLLAARQFKTLKLHWANLWSIVFSCDGLTLIAICL